MTSKVYEKKPFSEITFTGGRDSKGRIESWKVTVEEVEWADDAKDRWGIDKTLYVVGSEFFVTVQKQKDGWDFGATQSGWFAKTEKDVEKIMESAKKKAAKSAAH